MSKIYFASEEAVHRIGRGLLDRSLPKPEWTHAAHFAATLWLMRYRSELDSRAHLPGFIRAYNEATGVPNTETSGYHETITLASLRAAHATLATHARDTPIFVIANGLMASELGRSDWLLAYWSKAVLFSPEARREWVAPDLCPLPY